MENQVQKPVAKLIGQNGNIFNLIGIASKALKENDQRELAHEMQNKIFREAKSYDEALQIIMEYCEVE